MNITNNDLFIELFKAKFCDIRLKYLNTYIFIPLTQKKGICTLATSDITNDLYITLRCYKSLDFFFPMFNAAWHILLKNSFFLVLLFFFIFIFDNLYNDFHIFFLVINPK